MAQEHSVPELLRLIVSRLSDSPRVALARIWLAQPTADCSGCPTADACRDQSQCLHLVASGGRSAVDSCHRVDRHRRGVPADSLRRAQGRPHRGQRRSRSRSPTSADPLPDWVARPDWIRAEGIRGFAGQPLIHRGEVLGVLAVFARQPIGGECMGWLRMIADHAAAAIATARAFAEIEALRKRLELENEYLREEVTGAGAFGELVGQSPALEAVARQIDLVAPTDSAVLILGESGTGKELVAREIHRRSKRASRPLIKVNCAAVPRELYESEFFGHAKGAFTGALARPGRALRAGRRRARSSSTRSAKSPWNSRPSCCACSRRENSNGSARSARGKVNVRLVAATNRDLRAEAEAGRFRQDLYYRLSVFPVEVPPLRKRKEDIPLLADHFLEVSARKVGRPKPPLTLANVQRLQQYDWPGNVRELQHVIERAVITSTGGRLNVELPSAAKAAPCARGCRRRRRQVRTDAQIRQLEADNIRAALKAANGKVSGPGGAAQLLGVKPTTLASRIKALGIVLPGRRWPEGT